MDDQSKEWIRSWQHLAAVEFSDQKLILENSRDEVYDPSANLIY